MARQLGKTAQAEVVRAPFEQGGAGRWLALGSKKQLDLRNVFFDQLILQRDGIGGNHHPSSIGERPQGGRQQIGKTLPGAGARLHQEVVAGIQALSDQPGHVDLPNALLELGGEELGQGAISANWRSNSAMSSSTSGPPSSMTGAASRNPGCLAQAPGRCGGVVAPLWRAKISAKNGRGAQSVVRRTRDDGLNGCCGQGQGMALKVQQQLCGRAGVLHRPVGVHQRNGKRVAQFTQAVAGTPGEQNPGQLKGVIDRAMELQTRRRARNRDRTRRCEPQSPPRRW